MNGEIKLVLNINPATTSPSEALVWLNEWNQSMNSTAFADITLTTPATIYGMDKQLGRLTDYQPVFAPRVRRLHDGMIKLGYTPTLPKSTKSPLPSYISYIDPSTGDNFGNVNSQSFVVVRATLRDELAALPHFTADDRYAKCRLIDFDAVDAVLKLAEREKK